LSQAESRFFPNISGGSPKPAILLLQDETDLHLCPDLETRGLHSLGSQTVVRAPGRDEVAYLYGSAAPFSGEGLYEIQPGKTAADFSCHLDHLMQMWPNHFLFVACDNAPSHRARATQAYLKDFQDRIELVFFPTYSPNLNWIERLWRYLRGQTTRNHVYVSLPQQCEQIIAWLEHLSFEQVIQTLGGMNKFATS